MFQDYFEFLTNFNIVGLAIGFIIGANLKDIANAVGKITPKVERLNGTFPFSKAPNGNEGIGNPLGNVPKLLTVGISKLKDILINVSKIIATNCDGINRVTLGKP